MSMSQSKLNNYCLLILTAIAATSALIYTRPVLVPFVIALFFYAITSPLIRALQTKLKIPRTLSIIITIVLFLGGSTLLIALIASSIEGFIKATSIYKERVAESLIGVSNFLNEFGVSLDIESLTKDIKDVPIFSILQQSRGVVSVVGNFSLVVIGNSALIIIYVLFLIFGETTTPKNELIQTISSKISKYVATKFLMSLATGTITGIILAIFGVDLAFMFAVLTFLLNFIPSIGSIIAVLLPLPVVLLEFGMGVQFTSVLVLTGMTQVAIGNVIEPKLMGESMDLHPVVVMVFLTFWGLVWGVPGMFLAVPITAIIKIVLDKIETTKPIAEILAGRIPKSL